VTVRKTIKTLHLTVHVKKINLVTEDGPDPHALVWAQVVNNVADDDNRDFPNGATKFGVFISTARVPAVRLDDMDFTGNMAEAKSSTRNDGNGVRVVVDTPEVVHLGVRT